MAEARQFDPERVAYFETEGWRAYYDHNVPRAFFLLMQLNRRQFGFSWPSAFFGVVDVVRAYLAFQPKNGDLFKTRHFLERYYRRARQALGLPFDPRLVAQRELEYWIVHRVTVLDPNREPLIRSLAVLHADLFGGTPDSQRRSAEYRAAAATAVDRITNRVSTDPAADWREVYQQLCLAYVEVGRVTSGATS